MIRRNALLVALLLLPVLAWAETASELNTAGVAEYEAGRWDTAIGLFLRADQMLPGNAIIRRNLCNAYQARANAFAKNADYSSASRDLELAILADPQNTSPLIQLSSYYLRLNMHKDAIFRLNEALQLEPRNAVAHELMGDALYASNQLQQAIEHWQLVLQIDPSRVSVRERLAKAERELNVESTFQEQGSRHFRISHAKDIPQDTITKTLQYLENAYRDVGREFGQTFPPTPIPVILYTAQSFTDATEASEEVGALFDGKIRVPARDAQGRVAPDDELQRMLYHEYTHLVVRYLVGGNVPWWLNEGLAETNSTQVNDRRTARLREAYGERALPSLQRLEESQLGVRSGATLQDAYALAHYAVHYMLERFGQGAMRDLLSRLAEGEEPQEALVQEYRRTYTDLERELIRYYNLSD